MGVALFGQEHVDRTAKPTADKATTAGHDGVAAHHHRAQLGCQADHAADLPTRADDYRVVASNGGGDPPGWFLNLQADPIVAVQVKADHHTARARVATAEEKPELWRIMSATGAPYDEFQAKADREIPVVVLRSKDTVRDPR